MTNRSSLPLAGLTALASFFSTPPALALPSAELAPASRAGGPVWPAKRSDAGPTEIDGESPATAASFHFDVETDPTAFILSGYSLHGGLGYGPFRLDLGGFAMEIPEFVHGNADFSAKFAGVGAKLQYFLAASGAARGAFVGVDVGVARLSVDRNDSRGSAQRTLSSVGIQGGYRFILSSASKSPGRKPSDGAFYLTPWIGVGYLFGAAPIDVGEKSFELSPLSVFPAVHVGYGFD